MRVAPRVFLLSPAFCRGRRADILMKPGSALPIARELAAGTLPLGKAFAFLSGLYFRGKLAYAERFAHPDPGWHDTTLVITPTRGLQQPSMPVGVEMLREFAAGDVHPDEAAYREPLESGAANLAARLQATTPIVLLGSVATGKYVDVLRPILGERLYYPTAFIGRGDMSRGGLLLRQAAAGEELEYAVLQVGMRPRGPRPPRLQPLGKPEVRHER